MNPFSSQVVVARVAEVLAQAPPASQTWLSASEYARLQRLRVSARRDHYLAGHWLLRQLLATHCGNVPEAWSLSERDGSSAAWSAGLPAAKASASAAIPRTIGPT